MAEKLEGLDSLLKKLDDLASGESIESAMVDACGIVEAAAKKNAPKNNGELRRSIESRIDRDNGKIEGIVYSNLEYAPYVEFGTGLFAEGGNGRKNTPWHYKDEKGEWHSTNGMKPSPFLRPALTQNRKQIKELLSGGIKKDD